MTAVRAIVVIGISAFFLIVAGPSMFVSLPWPYTGIHLASNAPSLRTIVRVDANSPAYRAGLRSGDAVGCLSLEDSAIIFPAYPPYTAYTGRPLSLCYGHASVWQNASFLPARMSPPPPYYGSGVLMPALRLLVYAAFLVVGSLLVISRPGLMTWLLFAYCVASMPNALSASMLVTLPPALYAATTIVTGAWVQLGAEILALFALVVPSDTPPPGWRRAAFRIIAGLALCVAAFAIFSYLDTALVSGTLTNTLDESFSALTVLIVVARLATMESQERARFGWAAFAIVFGVIVNDVRNVVPDVPVSAAAGFLTIVMPLALMYAILRRHVIDVRFVLSRTVVYGIVTTLVVVVIGLVDWATSAYLSEVRVALAIDAAATIALGIALHRSYGWIESAVDTLLFRKKHAAEAYLRRAARSLLRADTERTIDAVIVGDPYESLDLTMAALFRKRADGYALGASAGWSADQRLAFSFGHDLVRFLATERTRLALGDLRKHVAAEFVDVGAAPAIAIPIFCDDELFGFTLYGLHRDGTQLDPDEIDALEHLCERAAQAYTVVELRRYREVASATPAMEPL